MKECVVWGTGNYGNEAYKLLNDRYQIVAYVDNDLQKQNTRCNGIQIYAPKDIKVFKGCDVIIAAKIPFPIIKQIHASAMQNPVYLFEPSSDGKYVLYHVPEEDICVPEYMDFCYTVDDSMRCDYNDLSQNVLRLFLIALSWVKNEYHSDLKIIEIGCGSGQFAGMLFDNGYINYIGYDFSAVAIDLAKKRNPEFCGNFLVQDIREVNFSDPFNTGLYVCFEVLEHLKDDIGILKSLPQGSTLLFSVPNFDSFNHVRKFNGLKDIVERYGDCIDIIKFQKIPSKYKDKCWFLLQGVICQQK